MPGYNSPRRGTARTLPKFLCCSMYCLLCVVLCIVCCVLFCVLFVCKCVLYCCNWVVTQLQLNISYHHNHHHLYAGYLQLHTCNNHISKACCVAAMMVLQYTAHDENVHPI
jgi:hypothetical protein